MCIDSFECILLGPKEGLALSSDENLGRIFGTLPDPRFADDATGENHETEDQHEYSEDEEIVDMDD